MLAARVMSLPAPLAGPIPPAPGGGTTVARHEREASPAVTPDVAGAVTAVGGGGDPLPTEERRFFEPRFGNDLSTVRVHTDGSAAAAARALGADAFTLGRDIAFAEGQYQPGSASGRLLIAHELAHVVQQDTGARTIHRQAARLARPAPVQQAPVVQPAAGGNAAVPQSFTAPLTDREWGLIQLWLSVGEVGIEPLTGDADANADSVAAGIFCSRALSTLISSSNEDPLLCLDSDVTKADPRVRALRNLVQQRGPIINWARVPAAQRKAYVMQRLINVHGYPANGAAGIVGNLFAESGVMPSRLEGSAPETPLRAPTFRPARPAPGVHDVPGPARDFTPEEIMNRNQGARTGPFLGGVGLAQWTAAARRAALFQRQSQGRALGASVLFDMDAQIQFLVDELGTNPAFNAANQRLRAPGVAVNDASDDVVYEFETPGSITTIDAAGRRRRLPRADPAVQAVFRVRRGLSQQALRDHQALVARPQPR